MFCFSKTAMLPISALAAALLLAGLPFFHAPALAQTEPPTTVPAPTSVQRVDPADPKAAIPALVYQSSLSRYQAFTEPDVAPWRATNDLVRERGGWRAYAREAREPALMATPASTVPAAPQPAAGARPAMPGHAGHEMK